MSLSMTTNKFLMTTQNDVLYANALFWKCVWIMLLRLMWYTCLKGMVFRQGLNFFVSSFFSRIAFTVTCNNILHTSLQMVKCNIIDHILNPIRNPICHEDKYFEEIDSATIWPYCILNIKCVDWEFDLEQPPTFHDICLKSYGCFIYIYCKMIYSDFKCNSKNMYHPAFTMNAILYSIADLKSSIAHV